MENSDDLIKYFTIDNKNGLKTIETYLIIKETILYNNIIEWNSNNKDISFKEKIYRYIYKIKEMPKCENLNCSHEVKFTNSLIKGYRNYCSRTCSGSSKERIENTKKTCNIKYGVDCVLKVPEILEKIKETNIKLYGVDNVFKSEIVKDNIKETNINMYGVEYYSQTDDFKEKYENTMMERHGVTHYSKTKEFKIKYKDTMMDRYGVDNPLKFDLIKDKMTENCDITLIMR